MLVIAGLPSSLKLSSKPSGEARLIRFPLPTSIVCSRRSNGATKVDLYRFEYPDVPGGRRSRRQAATGHRRGSAAGNSSPQYGYRQTSALKVTLDIVDEVFPIEKANVLRAAEIAQGRKGMSARDAVHIAIMEHHGVRSILSFDADFDRWPGLQRIGRD